MFMGALSACGHVHSVCAWCPQESEVGWTLELEVTSVVSAIIESGYSGGTADTLLSHLSSLTYFPMAVRTA